MTDLKKEKHALSINIVNKKEHKGEHPNTTKTHYPTSGVVCVFATQKETKRGLEKPQPIILPLLGIHHAGLIQDCPVVEKRIPTRTTVRLE